MPDPIALPERHELRLDALTTSSVRVDGISVQELQRLLVRIPGVTVLEPSESDGAEALAALTGRERDILSLIASGMNNQQVGDSMYLSINTIKSYIRSSYRKIGVETRSQAVRWAIDQGLGTRPMTALHDPT